MSSQPQRLKRTFSLCTNRTFSLCVNTVEIPGSLAVGKYELLIVAADTIFTTSFDIVTTASVTHVCLFADDESTTVTKSSKWEKGKELIVEGTNFAPIQHVKIVYKSKAADGANICVSLIPDILKEPKDDKTDFYRLRLKNKLGKDVLLQEITLIRAGGVKPSNTWPVP